MGLKVGVLVGTEEGNGVGTGDGRGVGSGVGTAEGSGEGCGVGKRVGKARTLEVPTSVATVLQLPSKEMAREMELGEVGCQSYQTQRVRSTCRE